MSRRDVLQMDFTEPTLGYLSTALTRVDRPDEIREQNTAIRDRLESQFEIALYLPQENSDPSTVDMHESVMSPEEVYLLDRWRVAESDFILLNADYPSFGVGQELEIAGSTGVPVVVYHRFGMPVSRMLRGALNIFVPSWQRPSKPSQGPITYHSDEELLEAIENHIEDLLQRRQHVQKVGAISRRFSESLRAARELRGVGIGQLAHAAGMTEAFVTFLEKGHEETRELAVAKQDDRRPVTRVTPVRFINPGLWVVEKLAAALGIGLGDLLEYNLEGEAQLPVFLDLCEQHTVTYREFTVLSERFGVDMRPRLLAAKDSELTRPGADIEKLFLEELNRIRGAE